MSPVRVRVSPSANFSAHNGATVREWAAANTIELAYTPFYASWLNRIEAQFLALRYLTLAGTDNPRLRALINTANVA